MALTAVYKNSSHCCSEGTCESISGLNSSSSCYDSSESERRNEALIILFDAPLSFLEDGFKLKKKRKKRGVRH
jgi:hypothetical protein